MERISEGDIALTQPKTEKSFLLSSRITVFFYKPLLVEPSYRRRVRPPLSGFTYGGLCSALGGLFAITTDGLLLSSATMQTARSHLLIRGVSPCTVCTFTWFCWPDTYCFNVRSRKNSFSLEREITFNMGVENICPGRDSNRVPLMFCNERRTL